MTVQTWYGVSSSHTQAKNATSFFWRALQFCTYTSPPHHDILPLHIEFDCCVNLLLLLLSFTKILLSLTYVRSPLMTVYKGVATAVRLACSGNSFTWACRWACSRSIFITRACAAAVVMDAKAALLLCNEDFPICFSFETKHRLILVVVLPFPTRRRRLLLISCLTMLLMSIQWTGSSTTE